MTRTGLPSSNICNGLNLIREVQARLKVHILLYKGSHSNQFSNVMLDLEANQNCRICKVSDLISDIWNVEIGDMLMRTAVVV